VENAAEMRDAIVTSPVAIREGSWLGLAEDKPVVSDRDFDDVAFAVADRLLADERGLLTLLVGENAPPLHELLERVEAAHPDVEIDIQQGGQPHYALLLSAE
jgi:dihydroxyacetone kinase-like predicted kinase